MGKKHSQQLLDCGVRKVRVKSAGSKFASLSFCSLPWGAHTSMAQVLTIIIPYIIEIDVSIQSSSVVNEFWETLGCITQVLFFFIVKLPRDYFYMLMYRVSFQEENIICDNFQYRVFRLFIFCREQVCGLSLGPSCGALVEGSSHRELRTKMCKAGKGPGNTPLMSTQVYV